MKDILYETCEKWDVFELAFTGKTSGNPFTDYTIQAVFTHKCGRTAVNGFYDGDGVYKVRFMPSFTGIYHYEVKGTFTDRTYTGTFAAEEPSSSNHGPVRVVNRYHFAYEDGTPFYPIGTTCYVWDLQSDALIEETFKSLKQSAFNKIRFCIFPKHYVYNFGEPRSYPYEGTPMDSSVLTEENFQQYTLHPEGNSFDFTRFNPAHFRHIETCIKRLGEIGIEADIIVMHPYDRWGFSHMTPSEDDLYWNYVIARFAAFRNVWWAFANEYDLFPDKTVSDWERYAQIVCKKDPYSHLRSIHNCMPFYDHTRPWITHCSIQRQDIYKTAELTDEWRIRFGKPVVLDEIAYEGNIQHGWGNISGEEMVRRFWEGALRGGYPGHGETYLSEDNILWWSHGGTLKGESWKRFGFLLDILKETPGYGLKLYKNCGWDEVCAVPDDMMDEMTGSKSYRLYYYSFMRPSWREFYFDDDTEYEVKVLDTWNMTVTECGIKKGRFKVELPGRQYMAVQIRKAD
ncbi:MAG: DUF5605 domain-containing protein [Eubacterium sp.]|nr:DUF5605 domain-containing protein [Eubacterium sp.]